MPDIEPTDENYEREKGHIALWLDPADLLWLSKHCCCAESATEEERERCARLRFRTHTALHKAGAVPDEGIEWLAEPSDESDAATPSEGEGRETE